MTQTPRLRTHLGRFGLLLALSSTAFSAPRQGLGDYLNVESPQVSPIEFTEVGATPLLLVCNSPDNSIELWRDFGDTGGELLLVDRLTVGLEPISVIAREDRFWVANFLGDSVTSGKIVPGGVNGFQLQFDRTINVGDEPMDLALVDSNGQLELLVSLHTTSQLWRANADTLRTPSLSTLVESNPAQAPPFALKEPRAIEVLDGRVFALGCKGGVDHTLSNYDLDLLSGSLGAPGSISFDRGLSKLGSTNMNMRLGAGDLFVVGGEAHNFDTDNEQEVSEVANGFVSSHLYLVRNPSGSQPQVEEIDLNDAAIGGTALPLSNPTDVAIFEQPGMQPRVFVAAMGSDRIGVVQAAGAQVYSDPLNQWSVSTIEYVGGPVGGGERFGPRGMILGSNDLGEERLYVLNRLDNSISAFDPISATHRYSAALSNDPTPDEVKRGRALIYGAHLSGTGFVSCASCHVDGRTDALAWRLGPGPDSDPNSVPSQDALYSMIDAGNRRGPVVSDSFISMLQLSLGRFVGGNLVDDKREMVTQSLQGLSTWEVPRDARNLFTTAPFHWRGDRETLADFNGAFESLLGGDDLDPDDLQLMEDFVHSIHYPPNPKQPKDRRFSVDGEKGLELFHEKPWDLTARRSCVHCHTLPAGTNRRQSIFLRDEVASGYVNVANRQSIESAALRGLFQKEPLLETDGRTVQFRNLTPRTGHFGLNHQGMAAPTGLNSGSSEGNLTSINTFTDQFIEEQNELRDAPDSLALKQYLHEFDWGLGPIIGETIQITQADLTNPTRLSNVIIPRVLRMVGQANLANGGLVAWRDATGTNDTRSGFRYDPTAARFQEIPDMGGSPLKLVDFALEMAQNPNTTSVTFLSVPLGSERRVARPDGVFDPVIANAPTAIRLLPMRPNTAHQAVPTMRDNWVPLNAPREQFDPPTGLITGPTVFDFEEFDTVAGMPGTSTEIYTRLIRIMQYGLIEAAADFGLQRLRHEAPRRLRVSGSGIEPGARLRIGIPLATNGLSAGVVPSSPNWEPEFDRRSVVLPLYPTSEVDPVNGLPIWETAAELEPEVAYRLMLGGDDAPGMADLNKALVLSSINVPAAGTPNGFLPLNEGGALGGFGFDLVTAPVEPTGASPLNASFDPDGWNHFKIEVLAPDPQDPSGTSGAASAAIYTPLRMQ